MWLPQWLVQMLGAQRWKWLIHWGHHGGGDYGMGLEEWIGVHLSEQGRTFQVEEWCKGTEAWKNMACLRAGEDYGSYWCVGCRVWAVGGEELWRAGWEGDCEGLNRLNHTVWTVGNEKAWDLLSRRGHDQIKEILPCTHYGIQHGKGAGSKRGSLRLQEPLGEDDED